MTAAALHDASRHCAAVEGPNWLLRIHQFVPWNAQRHGELTQPAAGCCKRSTARNHHTHAQSGAQAGLFQPKMLG